MKSALGVFVITQNDNQYLLQEGTTGKWLIGVTDKDLPRDSRVRIIGDGIEDENGETVFINITSFEKYYPEDMAEIEKIREGL